MYRTEGSFRGRAFAGDDFRSAGFDRRVGGAEVGAAGTLAVVVCAGRARAEASVAHVILGDKARADDGAFGTADERAFGSLGREKSGEAEHGGEIDGTDGGETKQEETDDVFEENNLRVPRFFRVKV